MKPGPSAVNYPGRFIKASYFRHGSTSSGSILLSLSLFLFYSASFLPLCTIPLLFSLHFDGLTCSRTTKESIKPTDQEREPPDCQGFRRSRRSDRRCYHFIFPMKISFCFLVPFFIRILTDLSLKMVRYWEQKVSQGLLKCLKDD